MTDFATAFADAWAAPTPERLVVLLHQDVILRQPHRPPIRGRQAALADFGRLFRWLPGLHGVVDRSATEGEWVFIEWRMQIPVRGRLLEMPMVDRFRVVDGLGAERVVYFDQLAFIRIVGAHPGLWAGYLRYQAGMALT